MFLKINVAIVSKINCIERIFKMFVFVVQNIVFFVSKLNSNLFYLSYKLSSHIIDLDFKKKHPHGLL